MIPIIKTTRIGSTWLSGMPVQECCQMRNSTAMTSLAEENYSGGVVLSVTAYWHWACDDHIGCTILPRGVRSLRNATLVSKLKDRAMQI